MQYVIRPQSDEYHDYRGYAGTIAGGVLLSTIVSFYLVPPLYTLLMHPRRHFLKDGSPAETAPRAPLREAA